MYTKESSTYLQRREVCLLCLPCAELLSGHLSLAVVHGRCCLQCLAELRQAERTRLAGHFDGKIHLACAPCKFGCSGLDAQRVQRGDEVVRCRCGQELTRLVTRLKQKALSLAWCAVGSFLEGQQDLRGGLCAMEVLCTACRWYVTTPTYFTVLGPAKTWRLGPPTAVGRVRLAEAGTHRCTREFQASPLISLNLTSTSMFLFL